MSYTAVVTITNYGLYGLTIYPPYSPDLRPYDFFPFSQLKAALGEQKFLLNEEAMIIVNNYFAEKNVEYYLNGLKIWNHRWEKYVEL